MKLALLQAEEEKRYLNIVRSLDTVVIKDINKYMCRHIYGMNFYSLYPNPLFILSCLVALSFIVSRD